MLKDLERRARGLLAKAEDLVAELDGTASSIRAIEAKKVALKERLARAGADPTEIDAAADTAAEALLADPARSADGGIFDRARQALQRNRSATTRRDEEIETTQRAIELADDKLVDLYADLARLQAACAAADLQALNAMRLVLLCRFGEGVDTLVRTTLVPVEAIHQMVGGFSAAYFADKLKTVRWDAGHSGEPRPDAMLALPNRLEPGAATGALEAAAAELLGKPRRERRPVAADTEPTDSDDLTGDAVEVASPSVEAVELVAVKALKPLVSNWERRGSQVQIEAGKRGVLPRDIAEDHVRDGYAAIVRNGIAPAGSVLVEALESFTAFTGRRWSKTLQAGEAGMIPKRDAAEFVRIGQAEYAERAA